MNGNAIQTAKVTVSHGTGQLVGVPTLNELLSTDPDHFIAKYSDIGAVNLACARGLPNCDESEFPEYLNLLDAIAEAVRKQTERSWRLFKLKPKEFNHSENVFRIFTMEHVFRAQFGIKYDPVVREVTKDRKTLLSCDSTEIFINGIVGEKRTGTCSSLPTFAIAVGRRLGYPLRLILVPNHTLYRWDDGKEVFNLQPTEAGGEVKTDDYFRAWPRQWNEVECEINARTQVWLYSLTPKKEVSKFLCNRALMLRELKRYDEAIQAVTAAECFDPINPACADIHFSIEYAMVGANIPILASGHGPQYLGGVGAGSLLPTVNSFDVPPVQPKRPPHKAMEAADFAEEHYRLVNLINKSNRNHSPQHPSGNPPSEPLYRRLNELL
jgi:hypothetical protein